MLRMLATITGTQSNDHVALRLLLHMDTRVWLPLQHRPKEVCTVLRIMMLYGPPTE